MALFSFETRDFQSHGQDLKRLAEKAKAEIAEAETLPAQDDALPKVEPGVKVEQEGLPEIDPVAWHMSKTHT